MIKGENIVKHSVLALYENFTQCSILESLFQWFMQNIDSRMQNKKKKKKREK